MSNNRILLVDDERDILDLLSYNLRKEGFEVYTAEDGLEGLRKAIQLLPRLIILDYMMPQLDGLQTCLRLREEPGLRNAIVVLLSARSEWEVVRAAFKNGANEYIAKPISPVLFVNKVKHLLAS
ncbi:MAG: response regulator [Flavobacteriales bacterium]|jgi:two-component system alkaline phosphatase synthesis response regulator PhoP|tara:strand:- start:8354 stop:8725 length:372 start_codon:yes stop_codon:yes gene_type:complete